MIQGRNKREIKACLQTNEKGNKYYQNLGDEARAVIRERFMAINTYIKKKERTQINNIILYLKELGKKEQKKLKVSRKKEITKVRVERNKINA